MPATWNQASFRGRNDNGSEAVASWIAAENANWLQEVDKIFRVRFEVEETAALLGNCSMQLQYNLKAAGWNNVNATSLVVRVLASAYIADGVATTDQMTTSAKAFVAGQIDEVNGIAGNPALNNQVTEHEFCIVILGANVADGDTIQLRGVDNNAGGAAYGAYTNTPTITVVIPKPFPVGILRRR